MARPKINQQLIAERLNISRATVSRCFTNHPGINPETRARVFDLASMLGYNHMEKRSGAPVKHSRNGVIGVLICTELPSFDGTRLDNPGQKLLQGLSEFAQKHRFHLDFHYVHPDDKSLAATSYARIPGIARRLWDGVALIYPFPRTVIDELIRLYPCVSLVEQYDEASLNCVDVNHHNGMRKLIDELMAQGHRRIGFFTRDYFVEAGWAQRRFGAFAEILTTRGLRPLPEDMLNVEKHSPRSLEETHELALKRTRDGVTAWVCAADHQAFEFISFLESRGLRVPRDVSITGFDGIERPSGAPSLSTILIPFREIGLIGGKRLMDLERKRFEHPQHILLDCQFRAGETIARPKSRRQA